MKPEPETLPTLGGTIQNLQELREKDITTVSAKSADGVFKEAPKKGDVLNLSVFGELRLIDQAVKIVDFKSDGKVLIGIVVKPSVFIT